MVPVRKEPREITERAKNWKCVRFNDRRGFECKFNKEMREEMQDLYHFTVKCYELVSRREEPSAVLTAKDFQTFRGLAGTKFQKFQRLAGSGFIQPLSRGFGGLTKEQKKLELQTLVDEGVKAGAVIVARNQDVNMQRKHPDTMQIDEGAEDDIGNMSYPPDVIASLQNVARNQLDNPQGRPPPSPDDLYVYPYELLECMSKLKRRASRFPDTWAQFKEVKQMFLSFVDDLAARELSDTWRDDSRNPYLRSRLDEIDTQLLEDITAENSQINSAKSLTEDNGPGASYSQISHFGGDVQCGVKNTAATMPYDEDDVLLPNHAISKALEVVPRFTGRQRSNIADIHPQVHVCNMAGDLQNQFSKPTMEANLPQVCFPAQPSTVNERGMWAEEQQNQFDTESLLMEHLPFNIDCEPV